MSIRGLLAGVLLLTGLEVVVSSDQAATRFGGLLSSIGRGVQYLLDPSIPAIPDRRPASSSSGGGIGGELKRGFEDLNPLNPLNPKSPISPFHYLSYPRHAPTPTVPTATV